MLLKIRNLHFYRVEHPKYNMNNKEQIGKIRHLRKPLKLESIVGMFLKDGELKFLVQWKDRPFREATFETPFDFDDTNLFLKLARRFEMESNSKLLSILNTHRKNLDGHRPLAELRSAQSSHNVEGKSHSFPDYFDSEDEIHIVSASCRHGAEDGSTELEYEFDSGLEEIEIVGDSPVNNAVVTPREMNMSSKMSVYPTIAPF